MTENTSALRCVCFDLSLSELAETYSSQEEARQETGCGEACGLCVPLLEDMIKDKDGGSPCAS